MSYMQLISFGCLYCFVFFKYSLESIKILNVLMNDEWWIFRWIWLDWFEVLIWSVKIGQLESLRFSPSRIMYNFCGVQHLLLDYARITTYHSSQARIQVKNEPPQNSPVSRFYPMFPRILTNKVFQGSQVRTLR